MLKVKRSGRRTTASPPPEPEHQAPYQPGPEPVDPLQEQSLSSGPLQAGPGGAHAEAERTAKAESGAFSAADPDEGAKQDAIREDLEANAAKQSLKPAAIPAGGSDSLPSDAKGDRGAAGHLGGLRDARFIEGEPKPLGAAPGLDDEGRPRHPEGPRPAPPGQPGDDVLPVTQPVDKSGYVGPPGTPHETEETITSKTEFPPPPEQNSLDGTAWKKSPR